MGNSFELHSVNGNGNGNVNVDAMEKPPHHTETEIPSQEQRDVLALARLGKKPILKVCLAAGQGAPEHTSLTTTATIFLLVHSRLYLHYLDHMGSGVDVSDVDSEASYTVC